MDPEKAVTVVRNYAEPRIVGGQLGLHPIISLVSMFLGLRLFDFFGMFGLPIFFLWKQHQARTAEKAAQEAADTPQSKNTPPEI